MRLFPTLFKKTSTGAIEQWTIESNSWSSIGDPVWGVIRVRFGLVGGKIQETEDVLETGKNIGKANETSAEEQAEKEAQAKWVKALKKGYVESIEDAQADKLDALIEGGVAPMLAHKFSEQWHKIKYPAYAQSKLDGHRCIAIVKDGVCTLWSRTRKPITGVPHINRAVEQLADSFGPNFVLDGELYNHKLKNDFEKITSFVRNEVPQPGSEIVQYYVYDIGEINTPFAARAFKLLEIHPNQTIVVVPTPIVKDEDELMDYFEICLKEGYEGVMVRNMEGMYVNKRSYDLQKVKEFSDDEFEVIGVEQGRGKMADKAIFVCKTSKGTEFRVKMKGSLDELVKFVKKPSLAVGKLLTVQYQGFTGAAGVPRFPIGLRLREDV